MITWKNVEAPNLQGVSSILGQANRGFDQSMNALNDLVKQRQEINIRNQQEEKDANTFRLLETIRTTTDMEDYEKLSLNSLLGSVGGNADANKVFSALLGQDDEIFKRQRSEQDIEKGEIDILKGEQALEIGEQNLQKGALAIEGQTISNKVAALNYDNAIRNMDEANKAKAIDDAGTTYGMDLYSNLRGTTSDREIQELALTKGRSLGYSGSQLDRYVSKVTSTAKQMRSVQADEQPYVKLAEDTINSTYEATESALKTVRDQVYEDNPVSPVFDPYKDITSSASAISKVVDKFPAGWANFLGTGSALRADLEDQIQEFAKDNGLKDVPPVVVAAAVETGITSNWEMLGNNKADTSNFQLDLKKFYQMYAQNEVNKTNRRSAEENYLAGLGGATTKRNEAMLDVLKGKSNISALTKLIQDYR